MGVHGGEVLERLADPDVAVEAGALEHNPRAGSQLSRALAGVEAQHLHVASSAMAVTLEYLDSGRLAGAVRP